MAKKKNYQMSKGYRVFDGKRYSLYKKCSSPMEAGSVAAGLRQGNKCRARAYGNDVYVKRNFSKNEGF